MNRIILAVVALSIVSPLSGAQKSTVAPNSRATPEVTGPAALPKAPEADPQARIVVYDAKDIVRLHTKLRYTTLIVLPKGERILDFVCGDKDFWAVSGTENFAYVKPAKAGSQTNLNLITAAGNIYSFALQEVSEVPEVRLDLKVFLQSSEVEAEDKGEESPRFVSVQEVENFRQQVELAKEETRRIQQSTQEAIERGIGQFVSSVRFPYRFEAGKRPFNVRAMYTDKNFTFIQARPEETPTLYELKDGQPSLVNFKYENGVYVVEKVIDSGYLAIGKAKLRFTRED